MFLTIACMARNTDPQRITLFHKLRQTTDWCNSIKEYYCSGTLGTIIMLYNTHVSSQASLLNILHPFTT